MPIIGLQRQLRELGRIRTGNQVMSQGGRRIPNKLDTFRLTSDSRELVDAAAAAFGGTVTPWDNNGSAEFEVITTAASIDMMVPPGQPVSQWNEMWSAGGCQRRCDGVTNWIDETPCACPGDVGERAELAQKGQACKITTRLNVILPQLPDLGVWRLESHGYYAGVELAGAAEILAMATARGMLIPARLRLDQRSKKVPGKKTLLYAVPIIEFVETRMADLQLTPGATAAARQIAPPARPALPATTVPASSDMRAPTTTAPDPAVEDVAEGQSQEATDSPPPLALTTRQLVDALRDIEVSTADAAAVSTSMWPDRDPDTTPLTDLQRGELLERIRADRDLAAAAAL